MEIKYPEYQFRSTNEEEIKIMAKEQETTYYPVYCVYFVISIYGRADFQYACKTEHIAEMIAELECSPHHEWRQDHIENAIQNGQSCWVIRKEYEVCPDYYLNSPECPYNFYGMFAYPAFKTVSEIEDRLQEKREWLISKYHEEKA